MRFSVYGRYELDVERRDGQWAVYRRGLGTRREERGIFVPANLIWARTTFSATWTTFSTRMPSPTGRSVVSTDHRQLVRRF